MNREMFGDWGSELGELEFAKAVLCAGMTDLWPPSVPLTPTWVSIGNRFPSIRCWFPWAPADWRTRDCAGDFAAAFDQLLGGHRPLRFELDIRDRTHPDALGTILDAAVLAGASSAYIEERFPPVDANWEWPLRLGFLGDDRSRDLRESLAGLTATGSWTSPLLDWAELSAGENQCDILLFPGTPDELAAAIEDAVAPFQTHVLAAFGAPDRNSALAGRRTLERAIELVHGRGVLVVKVSDPRIWLTELIRALSHDVPLDVAVWAASGYGGSDEWPPLVWAARSLLDDALVSASTTRLVQKVAAQAPEHNIRVPVDVADRLGLPPGSQPGREVAKMLGERVANIGWLHEGDGAAVSSEVNRAVRCAMREAGSALPPAPRHLQANVLDSRGHAVRGFLPGHNHRVDIWIGPAEVATATLETAFPERELPPSPPGGGHLLAVVLFDARIMEQPLLKTLFLPASGSSAPCRFDLRVPETAAEVNARITVLHENRVIQTALLRGPTTGRGAESGRHAIELVMEGAVAASCTDLTRRSRFDAAIVLNHVDETAGALAIAGFRPAYVRLDQSAVNSAIAQINQLLNRSDWDQPCYRGLSAEGTTKLLNELAAAGCSLYDAVVRKFAKQFVDGASGGRLQVVAAVEGARLPVEFIYDRKAPDRDARVCPKGEAALETGKCEDTCPYDGLNPSPVICPLGFWCNSRVIEWHAFSEERVAEMRNAAYMLEVRDDTRMGEIKLLHNPLVGFSSRLTSVAPSSIDELKLKFSETAKTPATTADTWEEWKRGIAELRPTLLLLLVHSEQRGTRVLIELGPPAGSAPGFDGMMPVVNLDEAYIRAPEAPSKPVVLLLGCSTGQARVEFQSVSARFADYGAAIVVSTTADIYGPRAVDLAAGFVDAFSSAAAGETFGDIMLRVRRHALKDGNPMVLCLKAYGDADWRLVR